MEMSLASLTEAKALSSGFLSLTLSLVCNLRKVNENEEIPLCTYQVGFSCHLREAFIGTGNSEGRGEGHRKKPGSKQEKDLAHSGLGGHWLPGLCDRLLLSGQPRSRNSQGAGLSGPGVPCASPFSPPSPSLPAPPPAPLVWPPGQQPAPLPTLCESQGQEEASWQELDRGGKPGVKLALC